MELALYLAFKHGCLKTIIADNDKYLLRHILDRVH